MSYFLALGVNTCLNGVWDYCYVYWIDLTPFKCWSGFRFFLGLLASVGHTRLILTSVMFFVLFLPRCRDSRQPITSVEFKFVARQVVASVAIRAAKLKFVAESRTRVYFTQHVALTCNTVFCCETSWSQTWSYAQQCVSSCNATMLRDKLKQNVARINGPWRK